ncbi:MAG: hypothetical protein K2X53_05165, partial [Alphaproteobacteria bacterium]|nr:hypothetical protein [Alphaproteobacteria bacterium]
AFHHREQACRLVLPPWRVLLHPPRFSKPNIDTFPGSTPLALPLTSSSKIALINLTLSIKG